MLAALAAILAGLPLAAGALFAARPFARAAVRYRILTVAFVLAALVGPLALAAAALRPAPSGLAAASPATASVTTLLSLPAAAVAAAIALALLCELAVDVVKLRRVKRRAAPLGTVGVRGARIGTSRTVSTPTAIGYLHPAVVLPEGFRTRVDEREWDAVVAHECAHLARRDDWAKAVQSAVQRACWWLPGLWILGRALDLERELAADERAAGETGPRRYAACLLRLATDRGSELAPAFGGRRSHVAIRVERLLRPVADGGPLLRAVALGGFTAAAFAVLAAAVMAVPGTAAHPVTAATVPQRTVVIAHVTPRRAAAPRAAVRPTAAAHRASGTLAAAKPATATGQIADAETAQAPQQIAAGTVQMPQQTAGAGTAQAPQQVATEIAPPPQQIAFARTAAARFAGAPTRSVTPSAGADSQAMGRQSSARAASPARPSVPVQPASAGTAAQSAVPANAPAQVIARIESSLRRAESSARGAESADRVRNGRTAAVRPQAGSTGDDVAFVTPRPHCRTCFGPLRSPEDAAAAQAPAFTPQSALPGASAAAVAADDPTAGPGSLGSSMIWFRYPTRARQQ